MLEKIETSKILHLTSLVTYGKNQDVVIGEAPLSNIKKIKDNAGS